MKPVKPFAIAPTSIEFQVVCANVNQNDVWPKREGFRSRALDFGDRIARMTLVPIVCHCAIAKGHSELDIAAGKSILEILTVAITITGPKANSD